MKKFSIILGITFLCYCFFCAKAQEFTPTVKIISIKAGNNQKDSAFIDLPLNQGNPVNLNFDQNYLRFSFTNSKDTSKKSFSYQLIGLDYSWITCENCLQVEYAHLDGGDYTFLVKTNQPHDIPAEFNFTVEGNIWHKWWFVPLLFFGVIGYFFVLLKFRQQLRQQRLIHKEKMASMADLTSGVAHEIQNPLNFVNNFSELSVELAQELAEEIVKAEYDKELISDLSKDILQNQLKISQHGQRASSIVKVMLEHSKIGTGDFQPANLNDIIREQLELSYKTFYANNKGCLIHHEFHADEKLSNVNVIQQQMAKALQNLFNNAFYTVSEKKKQNGDNYHPTVSISTKKMGDKIFVWVKDNGNGIPQKIIDKIFQPFFTTKPTGQGTGLGLSLSYDIIKAHGGEIKVESKENEGSTFIIQLPIS